jgi:hypothetical protein
MGARSPSCASFSSPCQPNARRRVLSGTRSPTRTSSAQTPSTGSRSPSSSRSSRPHSGVGTLFSSCSSRLFSAVLALLYKYFKCHSRPDLQPRFSACVTYPLHKQIHAAVSILGAPRSVSYYFGGQRRPPTIPQLVKRGGNCFWLDQRFDSNLAFLAANPVRPDHRTPAYGPVLRLESAGGEHCRGDNLARAVPGRGDGSGCVYILPEGRFGAGGRCVAWVWEALDWGTCFDHRTTVPKYFYQD